MILIIFIKSKSYTILIYFDIYRPLFALDKEVEIIEEPRDIEVCGSWFTKTEYDKLAKANDKKIEKLPYYSLVTIQQTTTKEEWVDESICLLEKRVNDYHNKINEIIDKINNEER